MKPEDTGPLPFKAEPKYKDPFLEAIAKNPRPLSMVLIGIIGMPLVLWLGAPDRTPVEDSEAQRPIYESTPLPVERVAPAPIETEPADIESEQAPTPATEVDTSSQALFAPIAENAVPATALSRPTITLIIDDIGYSEELGARAIALPGDITFAVLPYTPHGRELAETAHQNGKEIMLHAPMSNQANMALGPGALTREQSKEELTQTLSASIDDIPHLQGVNNHMGSALTELEAPMTWVMETINARGLYFVDSYTTANSVAGRIAKEHGIATITRNIFLDNVQTHDAIDREYKKLLSRAREQGAAVGIGHPYPTTLDYLEGVLPLLEQEGIDLVFASKMIELQKSATLTSAL